MATIGNSLPTLAELAKRMDPGGIMAPVVELLSQQNEILDDMGWQEGNLPTGHRTTLRTSLPQVGYRRFNEGVGIAKSTTAQIEESCAMMAAYAMVDVDLVKLYGGMGPAFRASENSAFQEAFGQQLATDVFFGNAATAPEKFNGLATRYNDVNYGESGSGLKDGAVVDGGGTGSDNTSIWLVVWGADTVFGVYPKGMEAGFHADDKGEDRVQDANGRWFQAYVTYFQWKVGLVVRDWRYVIRIANLDVSNLVANSSAADLYKLMARAIDRIPNLSKGRAAFYCNRTVKSILREQALNKSSSTTTFENVAGKPVLSVMGIPIRLVDALGVAEAQLT